jgi:hypothetical protein
LPYQKDVLPFLESRETSVHQSKDSQVAKESLGETFEENVILHVCEENLVLWKTMESACNGSSTQEELSQEVVRPHCIHVGGG